MAACNRCNATITFHQSRRTGRWYPCNSQDNRDFHKCAPVTPGPLFTAPAAPVVPSLTDEQQAAKTWISAYTGSFEFLLSMQDRVNRDLYMSDRQWAAITRSMSRGRSRSHGRSVSGGRAKTQEDLVTASFGRGGTLEEVVVTGDPWA